MAQQIPNTPPGYSSMRSPVADADSEARRFIEFAETETFRSPGRNPNQAPFYSVASHSPVREGFGQIGQSRSGVKGYTQGPSAYSGTSPGRDPMLHPEAGAGSWIRDGPAMLHPEAGSEDVWGAILDAGNGEFCVVPAATLERLRAVGEAQLAEIASLRMELQKSPEIREETLRLDQMLAELEVGRVCAENELELRRLETTKNASEASQLRQQRDILVGQVREAKARVEQLERWLDPGSAMGPPQEGVRPVNGWKSDGGEVAEVNGWQREGGMKADIQEAFFKQ